MNIRITIISIIIIVISLSVYADSNEIERGSIKLVLTGLKNNKGQLRICIFKTKDGFPDKPQKSYRIINTKINNLKNCIITIIDLEYGEYAIAILHDEDGNDKMKTGLFGIPKEGYGISKNVKGTFGPPKYEDAKIHLNSKILLIDIRMTY